MSGRRASYSGTHRSRVRELLPGRTKSEGDTQPKRRPVEGADIRSKSLGDLEYLLAKTTAEFEDIKERTHEATKKGVMDQVAVQHKERWKRTREVRFKILVASYRGI